jgi:small subunit ribosomal protein S3
MIERKFIKQNLKQFHIQQFIREKLTRAGLSEVQLQRTPLGDKIVIHSSRPGLVVGKGGSNIKQLTKDLEGEFDLDDPQIEIEEIDDPRDDAKIMAEMIANNLERYGAGRFKGIGHKTLGSAMRADALGAEIIITGKVPGSRARRWRFYDGYLKKCGETAVTQVETAYRRANLNSGAVGIKVRVMKGDAELPDKLEIKEPQMEEIPVDDSEDEDDHDEDSTDTASPTDNEEANEPSGDETEASSDEEDEDNEEVETESTEDDVDEDSSDDADEDKSADEQDDDEADGGETSSEGENALAADDAPTSDNTVKEIKSWLDDHDIEYKSRMLKADLLDLVDEHTEDES